MVKHGPLIFEYNQITPYIYIGTNMCCQGHFEKELLRKGIRADISLEEKRLDSPFGVDFYLWLPTRDHRAPSQRQLQVGVRLLEELEKDRIKVYVHCERGHGRAPTLVAAYLADSKDMTVDRAIAFIKKKRPVHPNKSQRAAISRFLKA